MSDWILSDFRNAKSTAARSNDGMISAEHVIQYPMHSKRVLLMCAHLKD